MAFDAWNMRPRAAWAPRRLGRLAPDLGQPDSIWVRRTRSGSAGLDLGPHGLDPGQDLRPQVRGNLLVTAVLVHQPFDGLLEAEFAQARPALVQVDADLGVCHLVHLAVQVVVDAVKNLATRHLVWISAAHDASPPGALADDDCCGAVAAIPTS